MPIKYQLEDLFVGQQIEGVVVGSLSSAGGGRHACCVQTVVLSCISCARAHHLSNNKPLGMDPPINNCDGNRKKIYRKIRSVGCCLQTGTTTYGAFVDIGTVTDGLIHISQLTVRRLTFQYTPSCRAPCGISVFDRQLVDSPSMRYGPHEAHLNN